MQTHTAPEWPSLIAFCGYAGSGKDTIADALVAKHGYVKVRLADPLKAMLRTLLELQGVTHPDEWIDGRYKELASYALAGKTPRHAMQTLGTEWGRMHMDQEFWLKCWANAAKNHKRVVVSDVRFPNEAAFLNQRAAAIFRIHRPSLDVPAYAHASEAYVQALPVRGVLMNECPSHETWQRNGLGMLRAAFAPEAVQ